MLSLVKKYGVICSNLIHLSKHTKKIKINKKNSFLKFNKLKKFQISSACEKDFNNFI